MRILILGINYSPEKTAVAPFTTGLSERLVTEGYDVTVITAFPYYPEWRTWDGYRGRLYHKEVINGAEVRRVPHFVPSRASSLWQRLAHDISFTISAFFAGLFVKKFDLIYCACPPPTLALAAFLLGRIRGRPFVIKLTDLASDAAVATGIVRSPFVLRAARAIESFSYGQADRVICLCQGFVTKLGERGTPQTKLQVIPDWADTERVQPSSGQNSFREANELSDNDFVVLHTGNMGKKQDLINVVRAAELSSSEPNLVWLIVGDGEERILIRDEIKTRKLKNIRLLPFQPSEALSQMYAACDCVLLNQKAAVQQAVIPSKLLTYMAAGRVVLAAVNIESEAANLIRTAQCGVVVPPEAPQALVNAARALRSEPRTRESFGANGRIYAMEHHTKERVLSEYLRLFSSYRARSNSKTPVQAGAYD